jgi:hypothetical protein
MAIIEPSPLVGNVRPTMIYVGGLDGMMHAICAEASGACQSVGQELWAFIPRTQLPLLKENTQRVDGSPKVSDVFADFSGDGIRQWRTVMTFQTGSGEAGFSGQQPAVYALDVTEPDNPQILWERTTPDSRGDVDLGIGVSLAMGPVRVGNTVKHLTFVQTNNGGTGYVDGDGVTHGPGFYLAAVDTASGDIVWEFEHTYPDARDSNNPNVPSTGLPGGVALVDVDDAGTITDVLAPSLYGDLWRIDATTGESEYSSVDPDTGEVVDEPLFRFSGDYHPIGSSPAVYRDRITGTMYAVLVSGGYADPLDSSWAPAGVDQYAVSVAIDRPDALGPIDESSVITDELRPFVINLGTNRAYASAVIAGNELYITTDSEDVNGSTYGTSGLSTGIMNRISLGGGGAHSAGEIIEQDVIVSGGSSSADVTAQGVVFVGSAGGAEKHDYSSDFDANGESIEYAVAQDGDRRLWLQLH